MESGEKLEKCSQNFDFYFQILENALLNGFECRVLKSLFLRTSIDAVYFGSYAMTLACGTAYLIRPTESNDPACGFLAMASGHLSQR